LGVGLRFGVCAAGAAPGRIVGAGVGVGGAAGAPGGGGGGGGGARHAATGA